MRTAENNLAKNDFCSETGTDLRQAESNVKSRMYWTSTSLRNGTWRSLILETVQYHCNRYPYLGIGRLYNKYIGRQISKLMDSDT